MLRRLEAVGDGLCVLDRQQVIQYVNPALAELSGYEPSAVLGHRLAEMWHSDWMAPKVLAELEQCAAQGLPWRGEVVNRRPDGTWYDAAPTLTPLRSATGETTGFVAVYHDISRLKKVERRRASFMARLSHALLPPLENSRLYLTLLERGKPEKREDYLQTLKGNLEHLKRVIVGSMELADIEEQLTLFDLKPIDLNEVAAELTKQCATTAAQRGLTLDVQITLARLGISADAVWLSEALKQVLNSAQAGVE